MKSAISGKILRRSLLVAMVAFPLPATEIRPTYDHMLLLPSSTDRIGFPKAITVDPEADEIFVCDSRQQRILIFDTAGLFKFEIPGGGVFETPLDVAVDPQGMLVLLASRKGKWEILQLDFDGKYLESLVVTGIPDDTAPVNIVSLAISPDGSRLYALDAENLSVWIMSRKGVVVGAADAAAQLDDPDRKDAIVRNIDVYGDTLLVPLAMTGEVLLFRLDGTPSGLIGEKGMALCKLAFPIGAAVLPSGNVLVVDQQKMAVTVWIPGENRCLGEYGGIGATPGDLYFPNNIALHPNGQVYISQGYEGRVQVFTGFESGRRGSQAESRDR